MKPHPGFVATVREGLVTLMDVDEAIAEDSRNIHTWTEGQVTRVQVCDPLCGYTLTGTVAPDLTIDWQS